MKCVEDHVKGFYLPSGTLTLQGLTLCKSGLLPWVGREPEGEGVMGGPGAVGA